MRFFLSTKEFWLTLGGMLGALVLLWKGLKAIAKEIRRLIKMITYTQTCLEEYGPTLLEIAKAFQVDNGKGLIESVKRIEKLSLDIKSDTQLTKKASDTSIDVLQAGVGALQCDTRALAQAFEEFEHKTEADIQSLTAAIRKFVKERT